MSFSSNECLWNSVPHINFSYVHWPRSWSLDLAFSAPFSTGNLLPQEHLPNLTKSREGVLRCSVLWAHCSSIVGWRWGTWVQHDRFPRNAQMGADQQRDLREIYHRPLSWDELRGGYKRNKGKRTDASQIHDPLNRTRESVITVFHMDSTYIYIYIYI